MSGIELAPENSDGPAQLFDHLTQYDVERTPERIQQIIKALDVLGANQQIDRPVARNMRELVVGRGSRGDAALLYRYVQKLSTVFVIPVKSQREAGYRGI